MNLNYIATYRRSKHMWSSLPYFRSVKVKFTRHGPPAPPLPMPAPQLPCPLPYLFTFCSKTCQSWWCCAGVGWRGDLWYVFRSGKLQHNLVYSFFINPNYIATYRRSKHMWRPVAAFGKLKYLYDSYPTLPPRQYWNQYPRVTVYFMS